MDTAQLFCWTMRDLDACISSTWHYHQMRIASLVRLLTFDESPLALQVNRGHRLSLTFQYYESVDKSSVGVADDFVEGPLSFTLASLDPRRLQGTGLEPTTVKLDGWLSVGALRLQGRVLSVREFVQQMAYVEGLVHAGRPGNQFEEDLLAMRTLLRRADNFSFIGYDLLRQIGRITHVGLMPLFRTASAERHERDGDYPTFDYG